MSMCNITGCLGCPERDNGHCPGVNDWKISTTWTWPGKKEDIFKEYIPPAEAKGWVCPRCGKVWAPWVRSCECSPPTMSTGGSVPWK